MSHAMTVPSSKMNILSYSQIFLNVPVTISYLPPFFLSSGLKYVTVTARCSSACAISSCIRKILSSFCPVEPSFARKKSFVYNNFLKPVFYRKGNVYASAPNIPLRIIADKSNLPILMSHCVNNIFIFY